MPLAVVLFAGVQALGLVCMSCTAPQRRVVRTVLDLADTVCGDNDTVDDCLAKCQAEQIRRDALRAAP